MMWMDLESIIQNEVSQKEKNTVYKCIYVGSRKMISDQIRSDQSLSHVRLFVTP